MRFQNMKIFLEVANTKSFTAAAKNLGMPKQTVSRRVSDLEEELNIQLMDRTTRSLHLTEMGKYYAGCCEEILKMVEGTHQAMTEKTSGSPKGRLIIAAEPFFGEHFLSELVNHYMDRYPDVRLEIKLTPRHVDMLEEGIDLVFRVGTLEDSSLIARKLGVAKVRYCAAPAYLQTFGTPQAPKDLKSHRSITQPLEAFPMKWPFKGAQGVDWVSVDGPLKVNHFHMAYQSALAGHGIVLSPQFHCQKDIERGRLVSVLDDYLWDYGGIYLMYPGRRYQYPPVKAFVDLALEDLKGKFSK